MKAKNRARARAIESIHTIGDLTPDPQNANLGTERGREALAQSLREFGPGRAVLIDRHGNIISGNKTVEEAKRLNIPLQVVKTDGQVLVAVQREDLDLLTDPRAKRLAIAHHARQRAAFAHARGVRRRGLVGARGRARAASSSASALGRR